MEKILEALKKLLPADSLNETVNAVEEILTEAKAELETEFNTRLEKAYSDFQEELNEAEKIAETSYTEAYAIIKDQALRIESQQREFEQHMEKEFGEAKNIIQSERVQRNALEAEIYEEYDKKLNEMKEYIVTKLDEFLQHKGAEIYEQAKRDVLNDPRYAEHKVTLDRVVESVSKYLSDEDYAFATSSKLSAAEKKIEDLQGQVKMMEARNIRLDQHKTKLEETVRRNQELLTEGKQIEKKERTEKAKNVSGRGNTVTKEQTTVVLTESQPAAKTESQEEDTTLLENLGIDLDTVNLLAGTKKI